VVGHTRAQGTEQGVTRSPIHGPPARVSDRTGGEGQGGQEAGRLEDRGGPPVGAVLGRKEHQQVTQMRCVWQLPSRWPLALELHTLQQKAHAIQSHNPTATTQCLILGDINPVHPPTHSPAESPARCLPHWAADLRCAAGGMSQTLPEAGTLRCHLIQRAVPIQCMPAHVPAEQAARAP
jgi:hypothetical protein